MGKTTAQRTGPKIKLKKILTVTFHDLGGHYVLDFSQGQKSPLQTKHKQTLLKRINLYVSTYILEQPF